MDMLISLHKHLNVKSIQQLSRLIANLDMSQHNEQTLTNDEEDTGKKLEETERRHVHQ